MAKYARENQLNIQSKLETNANKQIADFPNLKTLDDNINTYMAKTIENFKLDDPLLKGIRHGHLHMSSKDKLGLKPRFKDGKRWRQYYDG